MVHGLGEEYKTTDECDGTITRRCEEETVDDLVVRERVERADRLTEER
jgi:hypothetical protein